LSDIIGPSERFPALEFDPELGDSVSPLLHVTADDAPTLLIHGDQDELVPLSHSENIKQAFEEKQVVHELIIIEGAAHGFRGEAQQRATKNMVEWFLTHLLNRPEAAAH